MVNDADGIASGNPPFVIPDYGSKRVWVDLFALSLVWILAVIIANPIGEFPLGDDWAYAKTVQRLLDTGVYYPSTWDEVTLVSHVMWGALFCLPFGFSFTALRFSMLALGLAGAWAAYLLMKACGVRRSLAVLGALTMAVNPFYIVLSNTFMTDISFLTLVLLASLFFVYTLEKDSTASYVMAVFFSVLAILCRQLGILPPLAFAVAYLLRYGLNRRSLTLSALAVGSGFGAYAGFKAFLDYTHARSPLFEVNTSHIIRELGTPLTTIGTAFHASQETSVYLGLFLLPLLLVVPRRSKFRVNSDLGEPKAKLGILTFLVLLAMSGAFAANEIRFMLHEHRWMPLMGNTIEKYGVFTGITYIGPNLPPAFWLAVTALGLLGGALLLYHLTPAVFGLVRDLCFSRKDRGVAARFFLFLTGAFYYGTMMLLSPVRDRHLLPLVPILAILVAGTGRSKFKVQSSKSTRNLERGTWNFFFSKRAACAMLLLMGFFCFGAGITRDSLTLNRVRWQLLTSLLNDGHVPVDRVNGGFEFNGWYFFDKDADAETDRGVSRGRMNPSLLPLVVALKAHSDYIVAMQPVEGYDVLSERAFTRWFPPSKPSIFLLKRRTASPPLPQPIHAPKASVPPGA